MGDLEITFFGPAAAFEAHSAFRAGFSRSEFISHRFSQRASLESWRRDRSTHADRPERCAAIRRPRRRARRQHEEIYNPTRRGLINKTI